ncbi:MAG: carboxymuconolactone decarboxylase family protein [bacterium]
MPKAKPTRSRASSKSLPKPPPAYSEFIARYPDLGRAWDLIGQAGERGPLDERTARLVKLGIAMGAFREGAVRSGVRKALALGIGRAEIEQVVSLAAGTLGLPSTVAIDSWIQGLLAPAPDAPPRGQR